MIKAIIFDFDGLILDTETAWFESYKDILQQMYQYNLSLAEFAQCVGADDNVLFAQLKDKLGQELDLDQVRAKARVLHIALIQRLSARPGVSQYLSDAQNLGLKIALATSSTREWVTTHLTNLNLISYFDHFITQDDVVQVKPAPDIFLKTIEVLRIKPNEGVVFEDSLNGLVAAQKVKLPTVIIPNSVTETLPFADYHLKLSSMEEMSLGNVLRTLG